MTNFLCDSMDHWINCHCIVPPQWPLLKELIITALTMAFNSQKQIGWDQFFHGQLLKDWLQAIETYYHECQPGSAFTPDQWMQTTIDALWTFSMTLW